MDDASSFGTRLVDSIRAALDVQVRQAIARRIHSKVRDARGDPDRSGVRWPFELIQNAHDAGPRAGHDGVTISLELIGGVLRIQHDAAPFTIGELAALLTGGSSKDFDSRETTGRFGSGFLVTHVLSERVDVSGILDLDSTYRSFNISLFRPDDEDQILQGIADSEAALSATEALSDLGSRPTATLTYVVDDEHIAQAGLDMLARTLPHLFASCRKLRQISIDCESERKTWVASSPSGFIEQDRVLVDERTVQVSRNGHGGPKWRVLRCASDIDARGWLLAAITDADGVWAVERPTGVPGVFRQLPVFGAPRAASWVIVDGEFELDEERGSVHVVGERGAPLRDAFSALGGLAQLASSEQWKDGYRIGQLTLPDEGLGDAAAEVWSNVLSDTAATLASLPLVNTARRGLIPSNATDSDDHYVDFVVVDASPLSHDELWDLAAACPGADIPIRADSGGWSEILRGWEKLGVPVQWLDLAAIGALARPADERIESLQVDVPVREWLSRYLDAVGRSWTHGGIVKSLVTTLIPDANGPLRSFGALRRDGGVGGPLKAIGGAIGIDIPSMLLDTHLEEALEAAGLSAGAAAIGDATSGVLEEREAVEMVIGKLDALLPAERPISGASGLAPMAAVAMIEYLWESQAMAARDIAQTIPLLAADLTARRSGQRRIMVPPVGTWPIAAQPFAGAYPLARVLAEAYACTGGSALLALSDWGIVHRSLLELGKREELGDRALRAIAVDANQVVDARLRDAAMMQIALLEPEVLNHCKQERNTARDLLGFVVCFVAPTDQSWRSPVDATVQAPEGERSVSLIPSLWLSDVRSKPWIPVEEDDDVTHHAPNAELIRDLIDPAWLVGNPDGVDLLVDRFDMDALDVRLLAAASDEESRQRLRDGLARVIDAAGADPAVLEYLERTAEERKRDIARMRSLGLAVQAAVKSALEKRHLKVDVVDWGYDFLVTEVTVEEDETGDPAAVFGVGRFKVEVKATSAGEARLTPLQAVTAVDDRDAFVLCVVDLRGVDNALDRSDWKPEDVEGLCRFVAGSALPIGETLSHVRQAEGSAVPIRNTTSLRYGVPSALWVSARGLDEWVKDAFRSDRAPKR